MIACRHLASVLLILAGACLLASCDDEPAESSSTAIRTTATLPPTPSDPSTSTSTAPAEHVAQIGDICRGRSDAERALEPEDLDDIGQQADFFEGLREATLRSRDEFEAVVPPPELADAHRAATDAHGDIADILGDAAELLRSGGTTDEVSERFYGPTLQAALPVEELAKRASAEDCRVAR